MEWLRGKRWGRLPAELFDLAAEHRLFSSAGALAYFLILSVFPALICVNALLSALPLDVEELLFPAAALLPRAGRELLEDYASYLAENNSPGLLWAGAMGVLFSSSAAFRQFLSTAGGLYGRQRRRGLRHVAESVACAAALLLAVYPAAVAAVTGGWLLSRLGTLLPRGLLPRTTSRLWAALLFAVALLALLLVYRLSARGVKDPPLLPGALLAAVSLAVGSTVFSSFLTASSRYSLVYGSLASVIILMVWLYLCSCVLLLGAALNGVLLRRRVDKGGAV